MHIKAMQIVKNNSKTSTPLSLLFSLFLCLNEGKDEYRDDKDSEKNSKTRTSLSCCVSAIPLLSQGMARASP